MSMFVLAAATASVLGLTELPAQKAEPGRCLTFLWLKQEPPFRIAMIDEAARTMRLRRDRQMFDIAEIAPGTFGGHGYKITVVLDYAPTPGVAGGAIIDSGSMRIEPLSAGTEAMSFPVGGMRSCQ